VPEAARTTLEKLRRRIRAAVPDATEAISHRMPTFKYRGKPLVALAAAKDHCSLHLMGYVPAEVEADLERYNTGIGHRRRSGSQPPLPCQGGGRRFDSRRPLQRGTGRGRCEPALRHERQPLLMLAVGEGCQTRTDHERER
jgi:uncharacterized protein DUF1801